MYVLEKVLILLHHNKINIYFSIECLVFISTMIWIDQMTSKSDHLRGTLQLYVPKLINRIKNKCLWEQTSIRKRKEKGWHSHDNVEIHYDDGVYDDNYDYDDNGHCNDQWWNHKKFQGVLDLGVFSNWCWVNLYAFFEWIYTHFYNRNRFIWGVELRKPSPKYQSGKDQLYGT